MTPSSNSWRPTATIDSLKQRAIILTKIRQFFADRNVLEVETPLLASSTVTDPHVHGIPALFQSYGATHTETVYLQTSPEYAMKRLLAAGSGAIYQIGKAFRQGDVGRKHNPEFTMLEWYRPGFTHHELMNEMDQLLQVILNVSAAERLTYQALFGKFIGINPHSATDAELVEITKNNLTMSFDDSISRNTCLDLLFTHKIEPNIGLDRPMFIYDFPVIQAALAKIRHDETPAVASRFEVYFKGLELANGFHELQDAKEQRKRFENDLLYRQKNNMPLLPMDEKFLAALESGLPDCAGVALGVDRLVMLALEKVSIRDVLSFDFDAC